MDGRLSKDGCLDAISIDGLLLPLLSGLEKFRVGRARRDPPIEYSELRDGERA